MNGNVAQISPPDCFDFLSISTMSNPLGLAQTLDCPSRPCPNWLKRLKWTPPLCGSFHFNRLNGLKWKTLRHWVSIAPQDAHIDPLHSKYIGLVRLTGLVGLRVYRVYLGPAVGDPLWLVLRARFVDRAAVAASAAIVSSMALPCATISVVFGDALRLLQTTRTNRAFATGWMGWDGVELE